VGLATAMPEDKYGFKPTPVQRSFGEHVLHIAQINVMLTKALGGKTPEPAINMKATTKADMIKAMSDSFDYGAAVFFATKAQDIAKKAQEGDSGRHLGPEAERPAPQASYRVKGKSANIRKGPDVTEEVLVEAPEGAVLEASAVKGDWVKVTYRSRVEGRRRRFAGPVAGVSFDRRPLLGELRIGTQRRRVSPGRRCPASCRERRPFLDSTLLDRGRSNQRCSPRRRRSAPCPAP
jgi:hypothetical protein